MSVSDAANRISFSTDGMTTAYAVPFYFTAAGDLVVTYTDSSGNTTTKVLNSDYSVGGVLDPKLNVYKSGGTVTFGTPLASGGTVLITRAVPPSQPYVWNPGDPFPSGTTEAAHDRAILAIQDFVQAFQLVGIGEGPPTSGTFNQGDKVINMNPQPGGTIGWVYIGTVWYEFGQISGVAT